MTDFGKIILYDCERYYDKLVIVPSKENPASDTSLPDSFLGLFACCIDSLHNFAFHLFLLNFCMRKQT